MVDRATFRRLNPNFNLPPPVPPKLEDNAVPDAHRFKAPRRINPHDPDDPYMNSMPQESTPEHGQALGLFPIIFKLWMIAHICILQLPTPFKPFQTTLHLMLRLPTKSFCSPQLLFLASACRTKFGVSNSLWADINS